MGRRGICRVEFISVRIHTRKDDCPKRGPCLEAYITLSQIKSLFRCRRALLVLFEKEDRLISLFAYLLTLSLMTMTRKDGELKSIAIAISCIQ
jgi:hypothetical protein